MLITSNITTIQSVATTTLCILPNYIEIMNKKILYILILLMNSILLLSCSEIEDGSKDNFNNLPEEPQVKWPSQTNYDFKHPCLLHTDADFEYVRKKAMVEQKEPWLMGFKKLEESPRAKKNYIPRPSAAIVRPGTGHSMSDDGAAAYQLALMWKMTGDTDYAENSIRILNEWAKICKSISGNEAILVAGFTGNQYTNAAEIMRTYEGWKKEDFETFKKWLVDLLFPICHNFLLTHNGANANVAWMSWDLPAMVTIMGIGVVCDDAEKVNIAVDYFYNGLGAGNIANSVVDIHKDPDGNVETFAQSQEMGRDQGHSTLNVAQHAYFCKMVLNAIGIDLFAYNDNVILGLCEYTAKYNLVPGQIPEMPYTPYYSHKEGWHNVLDPEGQGRARPGWELIYNHYKLKGANPYYSRAFARTMRPEGGGNRGSAESDDMGFGTLMYTREPIEPGEDQKAVPVRPY